MTNLIKRGASGFIYVLLFLSAILYSKESYLILTTIFALLCVMEFSKLIKAKNIVSYLIILGFSALFLSGTIEFQGIPILLGLSLTGSLHMIYYLFSNKTDYPTNLLEKEDISIRYLVLSLLFLLLLPFQGEEYNAYIIIFLLVLIWTNDSFAFLVGVNFGKNKLFEKVSPKKTIEGFIGGIVFTVIAAVIISFYSDLLSLIQWIVLAVIVAVLGTIGDLIESKFKRQANMKDSGNIMPGHGGMLDRLDSLLFVSPFVYLYIHYII